MLVGADPSNVPINHPIRWPGSWHRKREPRICEIISSTEQLDNEIDLNVALAALEDVTSQSREEFGFTQESAFPGFEVAPEFKDLPIEDLNNGIGSSPHAEPELIAAALKVIPNTKRLRVLLGHKIEGSEDDELDWHDWNNIAMATWRATKGSPEGFAVFLAWSRTSPKYVAATEEEKARRDRYTAARWKAYSTSPPGRIGAPTIFYLANLASPGWQEEHEAQEASEEGAQQQTGATLPTLAINTSDPTATAKKLAELIAKRNDFLFNGNTVVHVAAEAGCMPRALKVTTEMVRVLAHEICVPIKLAADGKRTRAPLSNDIALLYLNGLEGRWELKPFHGITTAPILSIDGSIR